MDRTTYSNPEVAGTINERYIPVRVEADRRPDIQDRYLLGGWPTTAILTPDGRILTGSTYVPPEGMLEMLRQVDRLYHEEKAAATMHITTIEEPPKGERLGTEAPAGELDGRVIERLVGVLKREFDPYHGGFGTQPKFPFPEAVRFAFLRYRKTGEEDMIEIARKTLDGMIRLLDPVWGGLYRYSVDAEWKQPHFEKILYVQAGAMDNYVEAYQVTGDDKYGEVAAGIKSYLTRFLSDQETGGFYGSQDADAGSHDPGAELVPGEDYYPKNEEERLRIGTPYIDKTIYTDWNGMMASAYFGLYSAMGDRDACDFALKTINRILAENMCDGQMCHYSDGRPTLPGLLADQVHFAQALIDAYQASGRREYLESAEVLARFMSEELQDEEDGGFYSQKPDPQARGELALRHKPFDENVAAGLVFAKLNYLTGYEDYRELAQQTLKATSHPQLTRSVTGAGYGIALDLLMNYPIHVVVVGDRDREETQEMLRAGLHAYEPSKLVQVLDPEDDPLTIGKLTYPVLEEPAAYVCVQNVCTEPVKGSDNLVAVLEDILSRQPSAISG